MPRTLTHKCTVCQSKAKILNVKAINQDLSEIEFFCTNEQCKHQFVMRISFSHTTKEPHQK
ncbi:ogr/Delta-like zinc finger family protein [Gallibacterium anatis]|uniref:Ogr/Delta-like zinc finger n=2 Tax=Gallibacterium anatis TaxID=750 RepID=A0A377H8E1_9PAST|nr:ogr/Delta-like zinc finger family protein [Gallibacterium anatis]ERF78735.1 transcriptional regulator [Gallibacterium anatis 12656/12]STO38781.1 Ogr/Delta-like zinc finger [Gallibacterium anatis]HJF72761.1 ogr/Delta-like zinc finger family protein [Gallibacterium anatis]